MLWIIAAILSAFFAGLTSILAKCGIKKTDSDLATALRTIVVLIFSLYHLPPAMAIPFPFLWCFISFTATRYWNVSKMSGDFP